MPGVRGTQVIVASGAAAAVALWALRRKPLLDFLRRLKAGLTSTAYDRFLDKDDGGRRCPGTPSPAGRGSSTRVEYQ